MEKKLNKGDTVVMHTCGEAEHHNGKIWTVSSDEWMLCQEPVVMLEGFSGAFLTKYLQFVDLCDYDKTIEEHKELIQIMDSARKLAILHAEDERPRFRMDAEGNLTRIAE